VDYSAALLNENKAFGEVLRDADPSTPVPTCPDWTLRQLLRHVGRGHRWAAQIVDDRLLDYLDPRTARDGKPPDDRDGAIDWLQGGAQGVVDAVERVGADTAVWTFLGPRPAAWWIRRRLHEATVHRADAALALGQDYRLAPELAADGITEWLERVIVEAKADSPPLEPGQALHLHATDVGAGGQGDWLLRGGDGGLSLSHEHADGTSNVSGPATELLLAVVRRLPAADPRLDVDGDNAVWQAWLDRTPF
jgi:uncharacterized protein (TIGR03083 family)